MEELCTVPVHNNNVVNCVCIVCSLLKKGFSSRNFEEKTDIINSNRLKDPINLETKVEKSAKKFTRHFHKVGHNEASGSANRGNYIGLLSFLAKYDDTLKNHLIDSTTFRGTSNRIQNDLIKCTADVVMDHIKSEIKKAPFLSIALDETTDVANLSQLSIVVRYVLDRIPQEQFLGFLDVTSERTANALFKNVCDIISSLECGSNLVAQSYDGAAVIAGHLGSLQAKVKKKFKQAIFVHLVWLPSFQSHRKELALWTFTFPKVTPTRWNYNGRLVQIVFQYCDSLINFFQDVWDNKETWDAKTVTAAKGYLHWLKQNFDFNFLLNIFAEIFPFTDILFDILQTKSNDIGFCIKQIDDFKNNMNKKRDQFEHFWNKTQNIGLEQRKKIRIDNVGDRETSYRRLYAEIFDNILQ
ncbi:unnamed protein product [Psylliodes chrysocephalus]|uniref:DUF4371 domain-containing protein n=1 Tax=Psylliodes chrysocephalus TaxID=3402493 RepID=A0A9P0D6N0_9CUCU|nr:unnamed protein product [Psylliodes chrysocephala]